jgi:hypothetical protein
MDYICEECGVQMSHNVMLHAGHWLCEWCAIGQLGKKQEHEMRCTCEKPVLVAPQPPTVLCLVCGGVVVFQPYDENELP